MHHDACDRIAAGDAGERAPAEPAGTDPADHPLVRTILETMGGQITRVIPKRNTPR